MKRPTARSFAAAASWFLMALGATSQAQAAPVHNIVLVRGAFVTGAGWEPVYDILVKDGYHVSVAQHPLTSVGDDASAVKRVLAMQDGPTILVGHSYGGAIITAAGNDSHVVGLVYIAAHALDEGETAAANGKRFPNATKAVKKTDDGYLYLDPAFYHADLLQICLNSRRNSRLTHRRSPRQRFSRRRPPNPLENQAELVRRCQVGSHHQP